MCHAEPQRKHQVLMSPGGRRERGGERPDLELASLNNVNGLWAIGVLSSCLVPGSGMISGRGNTGLVGSS